MVRRERPAMTGSPPRGSNPLIGIAIIALGVVLLADNLGWFDARHLWRQVWPLVMVGLGVALLRGAPDGHTRGWGWGLILLGLWLFLDRLGWLSVSLSQVLLPGVLLIVGGMMVARSLAGRNVPPSDRDAPVDDDGGARADHRTADGGASPGNDRLPHGRAGSDGGQPMDR